MTGFFALSVLSGCADSKSSSTPDQSEQALKDPMHWRPDMPKADSARDEPRGVGTGDIKKDWDNFVNP